MPDNTWMLREKSQWESITFAEGLGFRLATSLGVFCLVCMLHRASNG